MQSKISLTCNLIFFKTQKIEFGSWVSYSNAIMPNHVKKYFGKFKSFVDFIQFPIKSYCTALLLLPPAVQNRGNKKKSRFLIYYSIYSTILGCLNQNNGYQCMFQSETTTTKKNVKNFGE